MANKSQKNKFTWEKGDTKTYKSEADWRKSLAKKKSKSSGKKK